jgi:hypothetical protein
MKASFHANRVDDWYQMIEISAGLFFVVGYTFGVCSYAALYHFRYRPEHVQESDEQSTIYTFPSPDEVDEVL